MTEDEMKAEIDKLKADLDKAAKDKKALLDEKVKANAAKEAAETAAEQAAEAAAKDAKDVEALEKQITKRFEKQINDLTNQNQNYVAEMTTLKIDSAIQANLAKHNIDPVHHGILLDAFKAKAKLDGTDAKIGDLSIEDHLAQFASSDVGKRYITAPANAGAGAQGSKTIGQAIPETWNLTSYIQMKNDNPEGAKAYASKHGKTF